MEKQVKRYMSCQDESSSELFYLPDVKDNTSGPLNRGF